MNRFVNQAKTSMNETLTENGAHAYKSTKSAMLDLFSVAGSLRDADKNRIERLFGDALSENQELATKLLFYCRNVRGGLGERATFRTMLRYVASLHPRIVSANIENIPYYGRWDDLFELIGTPCESDMWRYVKFQLTQDKMDMAAGKPISLLAKWLKSCNTSSAESRRIANKTMRALSMKPSVYRKTLSLLRKYIDVVEKKMSGNQWREIDYESVPSRAHMIYRNAFKTHDASRYEQYIGAVHEGEAKINSSTLYPYDIFEKLGLEASYRGTFSFASYDKTLEEQWKALPDYIGEGANFLVMADTSGSMMGRPMCTSVGLAMYFAERNHGAFKNLFMTFSSAPEYVALQGDTLYDRIKHVPSIVSSTNLESAFWLVLKTAVEGNVPKEDMPKALIVISDGEIDWYYRGDTGFDFIDLMRSEYAARGYEMPNVVMWNVASCHDCYLATTDNYGVQLASGQSPSVFKSLIQNAGKTAYQAMIDTLNDPMYDRVVV